MGSVERTANLSERFSLSSGLPISMTVDRRFPRHLYKQKKRQKFYGKKWRPVRQCRYQFPAETGIKYRSCRPFRSETVNKCSPSGCQAG